MELEITYTRYTRVVKITEKNDYRELEITHLAKEKNYTLALMPKQKLPNQPSSKKINDANSEPKNN